MKNDLNHEQKQPTFYEKVGCFTVDLATFVYRIYLRCTGTAASALRLLA